MFMKVSFSTLFLLLCLLASCKKSTEETGPSVPPASDRAAMLTHLADAIIVPSYAAFDVKLDTLVKKVNAFTAVPAQSSLDSLRDAWEEAYIEWQKVELFDVGPAYDHSLRSFMNIYPATLVVNGTNQGINTNITNGSANLEVPASYSAQGFPALDYLINGAAANDAAILDLYTTDGEATNRKNYLKQIASQMNAKFDQTYGEWTGGYRNEFVSSTGIDMQSSLGLLVNGYVLNYERYIRSGKFGIPSGALGMTVEAPEKVEAYYKKDLSLTLAKTAHQASVDFYNGKSVIDGTNGPCFKTYLNGIGASDSQTGQSLSQVMNSQFTLVTDRMDLLGPVLYDDINNDNTKVVDVFTALQKAVRLMKVDMTSAMSITITYTDNDGD